MLQPELPVRWPELQQIARTVRNSAWSPYSRFQVGAALLTASGDIVAGCNVENASYGLTICAERTAACTAIAAGHQNFVAICVSLPGISVPCGACRQFLMEFNSQLLVLLDSTDHPPGTPPECVTLESLLPHISISALIRGYQRRRRSLRPPARPGFAPADGLPPCSSWSSSSSRRSALNTGNGNDSAS